MLCSVLQTFDHLRSLRSHVKLQAVALVPIMTNIGWICTHYKNFHILCTWVYQLIPCYAVRNIIYMLCRDTYLQCRDAIILCLHIIWLLELTSIRQYISILYRRHNGDDLRLLIVCPAKYAHRFEGFCPSCDGSSDCIVWSIYPYLSVLCNWYWWSYCCKSSFWILNPTASAHRVS